MVAHLIEFATNHYLLVGLAAVLLALLLANEMKGGGRSLGPRELTALVNRDEAVVLDIRAPKDYSSGHIVNALNIPADKVVARIAELEKHKAKTIIVVDTLGQHSGATCRELLKVGFNAAKLSGGISSWRGESLPLVKAK